MENTIKFTIENKGNGNKFIVLFSNNTNEDVLYSEKYHKIRQSYFGKNLNVIDTVITSESKKQSEESIVIEHEREGRQCGIRYTAMPIDYKGDHVIKTSYKYPLMEGTLISTNIHAKQKITIELTLESKN